LRPQSIFGKVLLSKQDQHEVQGTSCWESEGIPAGAIHESPFAHQD
jgi:hypothetical protein